MLSKKTIQQLENSPISSYGDISDICVIFLKNLNIKEDTGFFQIYKFGGWLPVSQYAPLYPLGEIMNNLDKGWGLEGLENCGEKTQLLKRFIRMDSMEGQGSFYYDIKNDFVYDCNWGEEEAMISGEKEPSFVSSYDFFNWYYDDSI